MAFVAPVPLLRGRPPLLKPMRSQTPKRLRSPTALLREFNASDFEIRRIVGQQGYQTITDWEYYATRNPTAPTRTTEASEPAVRLYDAVISAPLPRLYNARVMLKEFLEDGVQLGVNEAEAYKILYEADGTGIDPDVVPVATLIGTFLTDDSFAEPSFALRWRSRFPNSPKPPRPGAPFLVFRWEGMQTGQSCAAPRQKVNDGNVLFDRLFPSNLVRRKGIFVRAFMKNALEALFYVHGTGGIVHRSIGLASIMVNTSEFRLASSLQVKIRDLGFAKPVSALVSGKDLERARKAGAFSPSEIGAYYFGEDIYALGYAFLELIFSLFSGRAITQDTFKKLFEDTFDLDISAFRSYCREDPEWAPAVKFLDERESSGWEVIKAMLGARENFSSVSLDELRESQFLAR